MRITIRRIEERQSSKGPYHVVHTADNRRYYVWDQGVAASLQEGATYEVEVGNGEFPRITSARPVEAPPATPEATPAEAPSYEARLEALRLAVDLVLPLGLGSVDAVLEVAGRLATWLEGGAEAL